MKASIEQLYSYFKQFLVTRPRGVERRLDRRKIGNNTYVRRIGDSFELIHFHTAVLRVYSHVICVIPHYSVSSMRRLRWFIPRLSASFTSGTITYTDPNGVQHTAIKLLRILPTGKVTATDYVPPPEWKRDTRTLRAVVRRAVSESFAAWAKYPVMGCCSCEKYAFAHAKDRPSGYGLWRMLSELPATQAIPRCTWHTGRVIPEDGLARVVYDLLPNLSLKKRVKALKQARTEFVKAGTHRLCRELEL